MTNFEEFGLEPRLLKSLSHINFTTPTPIQEQAIPLALDGHDILGSAQTGTGKTGAFGIPLINMLLGSDHGTALVLTPTRELGKQVMEALRDFLGPKSGISSAFLIGGEPMRKQFDQLKRRPRLIVGTPGRINDHLQRGSLKLKDTKFLVLDETDRMLDMGFSIQLDEIAEHMSEDRQTMMFSATLPRNIMRMADKYLTDPKRIEVGEANTAAKNIQQDVLHIKKDKKYKTLVHELSVREGSIIVFVNTKRETEFLAKKLKEDDFSVDAIHGDLKQFRREKIIKKLRAEKFRILVATDVVARGLDVPHIAHVINYDLPMMPEDYIHRIGRTARAGAEGSALCLICPQDGRRWAAIKRLIDPQSEEDRGNYGERPRGRSGGRNGGKFNGKSKSFKKPFKGGQKKKFADNDNHSFNKKKSFKRNDERDFDREDRSMDDRKSFKSKNKRRDERSFDRDDRHMDDRKSFKSKNKRRDERSFDRDDRHIDDRKSFKPKNKRHGERSFDRDDRQMDERKSFKPKNKRHSERSFDRDDRQMDDRKSFKSKNKRRDERSFDRDDRQMGERKSFKSKDNRHGDRPFEKRKKKNYEGSGDMPVKRNSSAKKPKFSGKKKKKMAGSMKKAA